MTRTTTKLRRIQLGALVVCFAWSSALAEDTDQPRHRRQNQQGVVQPQGNPRPVWNPPQQNYPMPVRQPIQPIQPVPRYQPQPPARQYNPNPPLNGGGQRMFQGNWQNRPGGVRVNPNPNVGDQQNVPVQNFPGNWRNGQGAARANPNPTIGPGGVARPFPGNGQNQTGGVRINPNPITGPNHPILNPSYPGTNTPIETSAPARDARRLGWQPVEGAFPGYDPVPGQPGAWEPHCQQHPQPNAPCPDHILYDPTSVGSVRPAPRLSGSDSDLARSPGVNRGARFPSTPILPGSGQGPQSGYAPPGNWQTNPPPTLQPGVGLTRHEILRSPEDRAFVDSLSPQQRRAFNQLTSDQIQSLKQSGQWDAAKQAILAGRSPLQASQPVVQPNPAPVAPNVPAPPATAQSSDQPSATPQTDSATPAPAPSQPDPAMLRAQADPQLGVCPATGAVAPTDPNDFSNSSTYTFMPHNGTVSVCQHGTVLWIVSDQMAESSYGYKPGITGSYTKANGSTAYNLPENGMDSSTPAPPPSQIASAPPSAPSPSGLPACPALGIGFSGLPSCSSGPYVVVPTANDTVEVFQNGEMIAGAMRTATAASKYGIVPPPSTDPNALPPPPPPSQPVYTFNQTPDGNVEIYKDGQRVSTSTPQYAAQFGYMGPGSTNPVSDYNHESAPSSPPPVATPIQAPPSQTIYVQSGTGTQLTAEQIRGNSYPAGTYFIEGGTGRKVTPTELGGQLAASSTPTPPTSGAQNPTQPTLNLPDGGRFTTLSPNSLSTTDLAWANKLPDDYRRQVLALSPSKIDEMKQNGTWLQYQLDISHAGEAEYAAHGRTNVLSDTISGLPSAAQNLYGPVLKEVPAVAYSYADKVIEVASACERPSTCVLGLTHAGASFAVEKLLEASKIVPPLDSETRTYWLIVQGGTIVITVAGAVAVGSTLAAPIAAVGATYFVTELVFRPWTAN